MDNAKIHIETGKYQVVNAIPFQERSERDLEIPRVRLSGSFEQAGWALELLFPPVSIVLVDPMLLAS